jgi:hypothetical protein
MLTIQEAPYKISFSRNPIRYVIITNTNPATAGLLVEVELFFSKLDSTSGFISIIRLPLVPDSSGKVSVDFSKVLDSLVDYTLPDFTNTVGKAFSQVAQYYIRLREITTLNPEPLWENDTQKHVVKGGLPYERWKGPGFFINFDSPAKAWMTWQPSGRTVSPTEKTWLSFFNLAAATHNDVKVKIIATYTDGSQSNSITINFPIGSLGGEMVGYGLYRIPAGVEQLGLQLLDPSKKIYYYELRVFYVNDPIVEPYFLYVDYTNDYNQTQFNYFNSLGGFDSVRVLGNIEVQSNTDRDLALNYADASYYNEPNLVPQEFMQQVTEQQIFKANIGLMDDKRQQDLLRDLLLSKSVVAPKFERWWPVNVLNKSTALGNISDSLSEMEIEYSFGFTNENYAPEGAPLAGLVTCPIITNLLMVDNGDGNWKVTWDGDGAHVSYVVSVQRESPIPPFPVDLYYTTDKQILLPQAVYHAGSSFVAVKAKCDVNESPYSAYIELHF